ncbi:MAG TPA: ATP-binding protein [Candidatus Hydrogenedentes bacterium]|nr:ATP-binding protein [Candidatus Hydrogenedentota bacterium]
MFQRSVYFELIRRIGEPRRFIQVLAGPRQVGKTTVAQQVLESVGIPCHYASADDPLLKDGLWLEQQWETGRLQTRVAEGGKQKALLILDEIQKMPGWPEKVKRLWDEDTVGDCPLQVVLLGSSPLLVQHGLSESLAGRFEVLPVTHWSFAEMRDAFGWTLAQYIYYGGYPGAAGLIEEPQRWRRYIVDSLLETTLSRDIFLMTRIDKPVLFRRLFELGCTYSGQILSYQKMLGQLQDAGNTTTLAHYLELLSGAGLLRGLQKYDGHGVRRRSSSPKLLVMNTALMTAACGMTFDEAKADRLFWGRLVESAIGAALANGAMESGLELYYWNSRNAEVDFVVRQGKNLVAIEVKSGQRKNTLPGLSQFCGAFDVNKTLLIGADGIPVEQFLLKPLAGLIS